MILEVLSECHLHLPLTHPTVLSSCGEVHGSMEESFVCFCYIVGGSFSHLVLTPYKLLLRQGRLLQILSCIGEQLLYAPVEYSLGSVG